jgi:hypothetical protein
VRILLNLVWGTETGIKVEVQKEQECPCMKDPGRNTKIHSAPKMGTGLHGQAGSRADRQVGCLCTPAQAALRETGRPRSRRSSYRGSLPEKYRTEQERIMKQVLPSRTTNARLPAPPALQVVGKQMRRITFQVEI